MAVEFPEKLTIPFDYSAQQFTYHHLGVWAEHIESLAQGIAHTQAADKYAGRLATS